MKHELIIAGEGNSFSIVFQSTKEVNGVKTFPAKDVRGNLSKTQLIDAAKAAIASIENAED